MKPREKKYFKRTKDDGSKKGSSTIAGYDEQNQLTIRNPKENPAPSEKEDRVQSTIGKELNN